MLLIHKFRSTCFFESSWIMNWRSTNIQQVLALASCLSPHKNDIIESNWQIPGARQKDSLLIGQPSPVQLVGLKDSTYGPVNGSSYLFIKAIYRRPITPFITSRGPSCRFQISSIFIHSPFCFCPLVAIHLWWCCFGLSAVCHVKHQLLRDVLNSLVGITEQPSRPKTSMHGAFTNGNRCWEYKSSSFSTQESTWVFFSPGASAT